MANFLLWIDLSVILFLSLLYGYSYWINVLEAMGMEEEVAQNSQAYWTSQLSHSQNSHCLFRLWLFGEWVLDYDSSKLDLFTNRIACRGLSQH